MKATWGAERGKLVLAGVALLAVMLLACGGLGGKVYDRDEFRRTFHSMHIDQLRSTLGAPDDLQPSATTDAFYSAIWTYKGRTRKAPDAAPDEKVFLLIRGDRVDNIQWDDKNPMPFR